MRPLSLWFYAAFKCNGFVFLCGCGGLRGARQSLSGKAYRRVHGRVHGRAPLKLMVLLSFQLQLLCGGALLARLSRHAL